MSTVARPSIRAPPARRGCGIFENTASARREPRHGLCLEALIAHRCGAVRTLSVHHDPLASDTAAALKPRTARHCRHRSWARLSQQSHQSQPGSTTLFAVDSVVLDFDGRGSPASPPDISAAERPRFGARRHHHGVSAEFVLAGDRGALGKHRQNIIIATAIVTSRSTRGLRAPGQCAAPNAGIVQAQGCGQWRVRILLRCISCRTACRVMIVQDVA